MKNKHQTNEKKISFVPKLCNPPNIPQVKPIEDFWSILSNKLYGGGWAATNKNQLENRIKRKLKEIDLNLVQSMMSGARKKLRKIEDKGAFSVL